MTAKPATGARVESLDVLRGLAAFAVVLFHVRVALWAGWYAIAADPGIGAIDRTLALLGPPMSFFGTTVMLFFVVSGFAIHYPFAAPGAALELKSYAAKRFLRIYPPYAVAVVLTVVAERIVAMLGIALPSSSSKALASLAMVQNYVPPIGQLGGNPSLWSLPVEVELYAVYPVLLWFWRRFGLTSAVLVVGAVSAAAGVALAMGHEWAIGNFAKYWIIWVAGAILADLTRRGRLPAWRPAYAATLIAAIALAVAGRAAGVSHGTEHFLWGGIYTLAVLWVLNRPDFFSRLPRQIHSALLWLGKVSYSVYLVHFPLLLIIGACWVAAFGQKPTNILIPIAASFTVLPVAYLLWRAVEWPCQSLARNLRSPSPTPACPPPAAMPAK
jgi:peptidoglycan/LPS O-acetylase OafA/YrhL